MAVPPHHPHVNKPAFTNPQARGRRVLRVSGHRANQSTQRDGDDVVQELSMRKCTTFVASLLLAGLISPRVSFAATRSAESPTRSPAPDCNLARKAYDNPFSDNSGW